MPQAPYQQQRPQRRRTGQDEETEADRAALRDGVNAFYAAKDEPESEDNAEDGIGGDGENDGLRDRHTVWIVGTDALLAMVGTKWQP